MVELSDRIKEIRKSSGLNQTEFGKIINVGKTTVSMYEQGNSTPNDEVKLKLANHFKVSMDYLFGRTDIKNIESSKVGNYTKNIIEDELLNGFRLLSKNEQEELIEILKMKLRKVKREINVKSSNSGNQSSNNMVG